MREEHRDFLFSVCPAGLLAWFTLQLFIFLIVDYPKLVRIPQSPPDLPASIVVVANRPLSIAFAFCPPDKYLGNTKLSLRYCLSSQLTTGVLGCHKKNVQLPVKHFDSIPNHSASSPVTFVAIKPTTGSRKYKTQFRSIDRCSRSIYALFPRTVSLEAPRFARAMVSDCHHLISVIV